MTVVDSIRIVAFIINVILYTTFTNCEINIQPEASTDNIFHRIYPEVWRTAARGNDDRKELTDAGEQLKKHNAEIIALSIICSTLLMCLFVLGLLRCYHLYFKNQQISNQQVVFQRIPSPTSYPVSPGQIFWQPFTESLMASLPPMYQLCATRDSTSRLTPAPGNFKATQQTQEPMATQSQPETPPPPYRETTEIIL